jgi:hypothetical protein
MATITTDGDGPPIVRILAQTLRRAAAQPKLAKRMDTLNGRVALRSTTDPQAATIHFQRGIITVSTGVDPATDVVISADLNTMGHPGAPKPKVKGALTHLRLALGAGTVLDPPVPGGWDGAAERFWLWADGRRGRPDALRIVCTDDGRERWFGDPAAAGAHGSRCELHAPAVTLVNIFTGGDHLGAALIEGRVQALGTFPVITELVGLATTNMFGDAP